MNVKPYRSKVRYVDIARSEGGASPIRVQRACPGGSSGCHRRPKRSRNDPGVAWKTSANQGISRTCALGRARRGSGISHFTSHFAESSRTSPSTTHAVMGTARAKKLNLQ